MLTYLRCKGVFNSSEGTTADEQQKFGPKQADHPSIGEMCLACGEDINEGDFTTLVPLGPGDDPEAREKAREGRFYNAISVEIHWECATGQVVHRAESPRGKP